MTDATQAELLATHPAFWIGVFSLFAMTPAHGQVANYDWEIGGSFAFHQYASKDAEHSLLNIAFKPGCILLDHFEVLMEGILTVPDGPDTYGSLSVNGLYYVKPESRGSFYFLVGLGVGQGLPTAMGTINTATGYKSNGAAFLNTGIGWKHFISRHVALHCEYRLQIFEEDQEYTEITYYDDEGNVDWQSRTWTEKHKGTFHTAYFGLSIFLGSSSRNSSDTTMDFWED